MVIEELERYLRSLMQGEFSSLSLSWNEQNGPNYETVRSYFEAAPDEDDGWVSPEERDRAFETNSCWDLHWYPQTPVGFHTMKASSLTALIDGVKQTLDSTSTTDAA